MSDISERIAMVRARIAAACAHVGRAPGSVRLIVVTKGVSLDRIADAVALGEVDLGENRVQELIQKRSALPKLLDARGVPVERGPRWHMIGSLQRNKVRHVAGKVDLVHSVDSIGLMEAIGSHASGGTQGILIEVNTTEEETKHGFPMDRAIDAARAATAIDGVTFRGFMTIGPAAPAPSSRAAFRLLRDLRDAVDFCDPAELELSMGMSGDFEIGVEEGATMVRVGTALFGPRAP